MQTHTHTSIEKETSECKSSTKHLFSSRFQYPKRYNNLIEIPTIKCNNFILSLYYVVRRVQFYKTV